MYKSKSLKKAAISKTNNVNKLLTNDVSYSEYLPQNRRQPCLNCWAESLAALLTMKYHLETKDIVDKTPQMEKALEKLKNKDIFSPQQLLDCINIILKKTEKAKLKPCAGNSYDILIDFIDFTLKNTNENPEFYFNFISDYKMSKLLTLSSAYTNIGINEDRCLRRNDKLKDVGVKFNRKYGLSRKESIKNHFLLHFLNKNGPMIVTVKFGFTLKYLFKHFFSKNAIITDEMCNYDHDKNKVLSNHYALLYGYNSNNGNPYWEVRETFLVLKDFAFTKRYSAINENAENEAHGTCGIRADVFYLQEIIET